MTALSPAPSDPSVVDNFHGTTVADPYRPLEDIKSPATVGWWKGQNTRTQEFLKGTEALQAEATLWHEKIRDYTRTTMERTYGDNTFFSQQAGVEPQETHYVRLGSKTAEPTVLIDPKTLSLDGTVSISTFSPSPDGKIVAYTTNKSGSDIQTLHFRDVGTGQDVFETVHGLRFSDITWDPDGKGVIFNKPLPKLEAEGSHYAPYHHKLGDDPTQNTLLLKRTDVNESFVSASRTDKDDPYLLFSVGSGTNPENGLYIQKPGQTELIEVLAPKIAELSPFDRIGDTLYATTSLDAPRSRVVAIDINNPAPQNWKTLVAESTDPGDKLKHAFVIDGKLMVAWSKGGADTLEQRELDGTKVSDVPIPPGSTITYGQVKPQNKSFELSIGGYLSPGTRYQYTVASNQLDFVKKSDIPRDLTQIAEVERQFATSKDGTQVPMWIIRPKAMKKDGSNPTLLYGYGGFNVPMAPGFSMDIMHWVEQGGVYVVANLRGGGEFGKAWYDAGRLKNKQNVFDDFAACAEYLSQQGYTRPDKLAIYGGSNGGLLTAVVSQQYPQLIGAAISAVPVTDMFRFQTDNAGSFWKSDYGDPATPEDFAVSAKYSPLHNVAPASQTTYPPTLIMTGDHDNRVAPWHAFKLTATRLEKGHDTTYLHVEEEAGHGAGKPTQKVIENSVTRWAFLNKALGLTPKSP